MAIGIISGAISAGMSIFGAIKAGREKKRAKEAIDNYERQELKNPYASISRLPNEAIAMQNEMSARGLANASQVARTSNRGFAALPGATQAYEDSVRQTAAMAEQYGLQREQLIAQGEAYRQDMMERREEADIAGLAQEYAVADQNLRNDLVSLGTSITSGLSAAADQYGWGQGGEAVTDVSSSTSGGGFASTWSKPPNYGNILGPELNLPNSGFSNPSVGPGQITFGNTPAQGGRYALPPVNMPTIPGAKSGMGGVHNQWNL